ncbi:MAG: DUF4388 domain-containing protein, partial [Myxococcales bacterium]|nr:DUF4388 domain-containing protein [Myxococcales bacterium]
MNGLTVLVVHPIAEHAQALGQHLGSAGCRVTIVPSGERAIDLFIQEPAQALIVDLVLPGRDGRATIDSIRWAPGGKECAIVLTGTSVQPDVLARFADALGVAHAPGVAPEVLAPLAAQMGEGSSSRPTRALPRSGVAQLFRDDLYDENVDADASDFDGHSTRSGEFSSAPAEREEPADPKQLDTIAEREGRDLEHRANAMGAMARLEGRLEEIPFARVLTRLAELRATGALLLDSEGDSRATTTQESVKKIVFFRSGVAVQVRSNLVDECLGQILAKSGSIDTEALRESLDAVAEGAGRQGGILVAMGAITPHQLRDTLELQQRLKILDVFGWPAGTFRFSEGMAPPSVTVGLETSLAELVYEGITQRVPGLRALDAIAAHSGEYVVSDPRRFQPFLQRIDEAELRELHERIDGQRTLQQLLEFGKGSRSRLAQLLFALECMGAIAFRATPLASNAPQHAEPAAMEELDERSMTREALETLAQRLERGELAALLGVNPLDGSGMRRASRRLDARLAEIASPKTSSRAMRTLALRARARLRALAEAPAASVIDTQPLPAQPTKPSKPERAAAEVRPPEAEEAHAWAGTDSFTLREQDRPTRPPPASEEAELVIDEEIELISLDDEVETLERAEAAFRQGELALREMRLDEAARALEQACELCPEDGEFAAYHGYVVHAARPQDAEATRLSIAELGRGARLAPALDIVHLLRARVLRNVGDLPGARNAFERALTANPDCAEALEGLRTL